MDIRELYIKLSGLITAADEGSQQKNELDHFLVTTPIFTPYIYFPIRSQYLSIKWSPEIRCPIYKTILNHITNADSLHIINSSAGLYYQQPHTPMVILIWCSFFDYYETKTDTSLKYHERLALTLEYMLREVFPEVKNLHGYDEYIEWACSGVDHEEEMQKLLRFVKYDILKQAPSSFSDYAYLI